MELAELGYYVHLHTSKEKTFKGSNFYATFFSAEFMKQLSSVPTLFDQNQLVGRIALDTHRDGFCK